MGFTVGQERCINTLDKPLIVAAGAGSGKTFTLTQRIVGALKSGYITDVDQLLAITYTNKAAREIKTRVCRELRANGMVEQSLKAEDAWISTIHGMCSRILKQHALELDINPNFKIVSGATERDLKYSALKETIDQIEKILTPEERQALLGEYDMRTEAFRGVSIESLVQQLMSLLERQVAGKAIKIPGTQTSRRACISQMLDIAADWLAEAQQQKDSASKAKVTDALQNAIDACNDSMARKSLDSMSLSEFFSLVNLFPTKGSNFGNADYKSKVKEDYAPAMLNAAREAAFSYSQTLLASLVKLAKHANSVAAADRKQLGMLSNNDLLSLTYQAMDNYPEIAAEYQNRFKLVMVDEFQDTNQMQVDMISRLAGTDGERLCVVGDSQQSIYRFQGADVSVYQRHLEKLRTQNPKSVITLPDNFRSHHDILAFVDRVFEQDAAFGADFMSLTASRDESKCDQTFNNLDARVEIQLSTKSYAKSPQASDSTVPLAAERIAKRFAELHEQGYKQKDMVILMGTTTHQDTYVTALRNAGLSCVVAKGSVFNRAPEVQSVCHLVSAIANPNDTQALYRALSSDMFELSVNDYLQLAAPTKGVDGNMYKQNMAQGIYNVERLVRLAEDGEEPVSPALACAARTLVHATWKLGRKPLHQIVTEAIAESGVLTRFEDGGAEGVAKAANILKALRILENREKEESCGASTLAQFFAEEIDATKEAPGTLSTEGNDAVRIMTMHSSKGLEFPIVAVTEYNGTASRNVLETYESGNDIYLTLAPNKLKETGDTVKEALANPAGNPLDFADPDELPRLIKAEAPVGSIAKAMNDATVSADNMEKLRLFYVGITRAKEMLILCMENKGKSGNANGECAFIDQLVSDALCGVGGTFADDEGAYNFKGHKPALFQRVFTDVHDKDEVVEEDQTDASPFTIYAEPNRLHMKHGPIDDSRKGMFSYSSIMPAFEGDRELEMIADMEDINEHMFGMDGGLTPHFVIGVEDEDAEGDSTYIRKAKIDADKATNMGTVFHRLAQYAVLMWKYTGKLEIPDGERIEILARSYGLSQEQKLRLEGALIRWFNSKLAKILATLPKLRAEVPFSVTVDTKLGPATMEGEMDLLATADVAKSAVVVDYKTGGHPGEVMGQLRKKHVLQASCYAYALLRQGFDEVTCHFVRVEVPDMAKGGPQIVSFNFTTENIDEISRVIAETYEKAHS